MSVIDMSWTGIPGLELIIKEKDTMTTQYPPEVMRLVEQAEDALNVVKIQCGYRPAGLEAALAPFRPDPDEALVEEMVKALMVADNTGSLDGKYAIAAYQRLARTALATVKAAGYVRKGE